MIGEATDIQNGKSGNSHPKATYVRFPYNVYVEHDYLNLKLTKPISPNFPIVSMVCV